MRILLGVITMLITFGITVIVGLTRGQISWDIAIGSGIGGFIIGAIIAPKLFVRGKGKPQK